MRSFLASVLMLTFYALGDSAVMFDFPDGRTVAVTGTDQITMTAETVLVYPTGGMVEGFLPEMRVECIFHLLNRSDQTVNVTVGFPIDAIYGDSYTVFPESLLVAMLDSLHAGEGRRPWFLTGPGDATGALPPEAMDFTASVNGSPVEVAFRACAYSREEALIRNPIAAVWPMRFKPGESQRLVNTYTTSWSYFGGFSFSSWSLSYIVTTGATWMGPIGTALIRFTVPDSLPMPGISPERAACWKWSGSPVVDDRTLTWTMRDWEPAENLSITVKCQDLTDWQYEGAVDPLELASAVTWEAEALLHTAGSHLEQAIWGDPLPPGTVLQILKALLAGETSQEPSPGAMFLAHPRTVPRELQGEGWPEAVRGAEAALASDAALVRREGLEAFIPLLYHQWLTLSDLDMYQGMPDLMENWLRLLLHWEAACSGDPIGDPGVRAAYRLTGWYNPGSQRWSQRVVGITREAVEAYRAEMHFTEGGPR